VWGCTPAIPALTETEVEDLKFQTSLSYKAKQDFVLNKQTNKTTTTKMPIELFFVFWVFFLWTGV
jgi:hypothetical protein